MKCFKKENCCVFSQLQCNYNACQLEKGLILWFLHAAYAFRYIPMPMFIHPSPHLSSHPPVGSSNIQSILKQIGPLGDHLGLPWASFSSYLSTAPVCLNGEGLKSPKLFSTQIRPCFFRLFQLILYSYCMQQTKHKKEHLNIPKYFIKWFY